MPTEIAATVSRRGQRGTFCSRTSRAKAMARATHAPVMAAQRVPPSAWRTSQSSVIVRSPMPRSSVTLRSERPMSRWISCVRPPCRPCAASRAERVCVARGSIPYSAVTQPLPLPFRNGGTRSSTEAAQSTCVSPRAIRAEPSAWRATPVWIATGRRSPGARPSGRGVTASPSSPEPAPRRPRPAA